MRDSEGSSFWDVERGSGWSGTRSVPEVVMDDDEGERVWTRISDG